MKYLIPAILVIISLSGFGCLEVALKYPKEYSEFQTNQSRENPTNETIELTGVVSSLDLVLQTFQLITTDGSSENITFTSETIFSTDREANKNLSSLTSGSLVKISGTRDLASLVTTARTIQELNSQSIFITAPEPSATITSPLVVEGFTNIQTTKIFWRIKNNINDTKFSGFSFFAPAENSFAPLRLEIFLPALENNNFTLEIFSKNSQTSAEENLLSLPLRLLSTNTSSFQVFFANDRLNTSRACDAVFPVKRTVAETSAIGRESVLEILNGPTEAERLEGYRSSLSNNITVNTLAISGGVATVTVSLDWEKISTCEKQLAEEQIKQTLLQIGSVKDVKIRVE